MERPIKIKMTERPSEIRMGSPYNLTQFSFSGTNLELPKYDWQDKYAWSNDNKYLALIQYNLTDNKPGFHFYVIDTEMDTLVISPRISGLVKKISIKEGKVFYNKFLLDRKKSKPRELCCHTDEEYVIK